jgi:6-pyruvoyltetrahydropterin/6-carboxytetrahydropterin synthase
VGVTYTIAKQFSFAASHHLDRLPPGHKCGRVHGHTYTVQVLLASEDLDEAGFVTDYADLDPLRHYWPGTSSAGAVITSGRGIW